MQQGRIFTTGAGPVQLSQQQIAERIVELGEQIRRYELQAECLAGVFMGSVWESLDRTE